MMPKYIDIEKEITEMQQVVEFHKDDKTSESEIASFAFQAIINKLKSVPAADVAPVIHAKWVRGKIGYSCSHCLCGDDFVNPSTCYCPNCGASMDLDAIGTIEYEKEGTK